MKPERLDMGEMVRWLALTFTVRNTLIPKARLVVGVAIIRLGAWVVGFGHINVRNIAAEVQENRRSDARPPDVHWE